MESRGITGREMAKETGLTVQTVSHVLLGRHEPKKSTLRLIQRCLSKHPILSLMAEAMG